jgi:hypothetical protein
VPPHLINGGWEWNGWHWGLQVIRDSVLQGKPEQRGRQLQTYIFQTLRMRDARWTIRFEPLPERRAGRLHNVVPYGLNSQVYAVEKL